MPGEYERANTDPLQVVEGVINMRLEHFKMRLENAEMESRDCRERVRLMSDRILILEKDATISRESAISQGKRLEAHSVDMGQLKQTRSVLIVLGAMAMLLLGALAKVMFGKL